MSQFKADVEQMVANAKKYNVKESQVYEDAVKILVNMTQQIRHYMIAFLILCSNCIEICKKLEWTKRKGYCQASSTSICTSTRHQDQGN